MDLNPQPGENITVRHRVQVRAKATVIMQQLQRFTPPFVHLIEVVQSERLSQLSLH
jgi:hypothetical protein